ncbi:MULTISPECIES: cation transporter [Nocardia]|uniref:cation transporter n=1 Tax=Nocardia TaxID=1817 RepID=UPI00352BC479
MRDDVLVLVAVPVMPASSGPLPAEDAAAAPRRLEVAIGGMTCASCATRIERRLNTMDSVVATVNFATEKARVEIDSDTADADVIEVIEATGYTARIPHPVRGPDSETSYETETYDTDTRSLRQRMRVSVALALAVPVVAMAMVPPLQFTNWAVAAAHPGGADSRVGRLAVPPSGVDEPASRRRDHGHSHLGGRAGRVRLVAVRAVSR